MLKVSKSVSKSRFTSWRHYFLLGVNFFCFLTLNLWFKFEWSVLTSSFHSSKLQSSFRSSRLHPSWIHELSVRHICADSKVSDHISDFEFSSSKKSDFDVVPLSVSFVSLIPFDFPLDIFLNSFTPLFVFTLGSWLALSVLVRRSLVCTITALQSRWKKALAYFKHSSRGLDDPLLDEREMTASRSMGSECPHWFRVTWNHELSNKTSSPRTSRFPDAYPRKFVSDLSWISDTSQAPPTQVLPDK